LGLFNVRWLISELDTGDVLLVNPLLKELGLDAPAHLASVREAFHIMDCSTVSSISSGGLLLRLMKSIAETSQCNYQIRNLSPDILHVGSISITPGYLSPSAAPYSGTSIGRRGLASVNSSDHAVSHGDLACRPRVPSTPDRHAVRLL
jgi:hypothetical protein